MAKEDYILEGCPNCRQPLEKGKCLECEKKIKEEDRIRLKQNILWIEAKKVSHNKPEVKVPVVIIRADEGEEIFQPDWCRKVYGGGK